MTVWVTGAAGFIGSSLVQRLAELDADHVVGIDAFTDYYAIEQKRANWEALAKLQGVTLIEEDLLQSDLRRLARPRMIYHLAGQPGVRPSWGPQFVTYLDRNVRLTERLATFCAEIGVQLVYASSSSVYGVLPDDAAAREDSVTVPHSPYGISKLGGELIVRSYGANLGLEGASVRYFTVYGPRQRPDMAIHRLCRAALRGEEFPLYGDGSQLREFTFVDDVVEATLRAGDCASASSPVFNVAGGSTVSLAHLMALVEEISGRKLSVKQMDRAVGDVPVTRADLERTRAVLGWTARTDLRAGVSAQWSWHSALETG